MKYELVKVYTLPGEEWIHNANCNCSKVKWEEEHKENSHYTFERLGKYSINKMVVKGKDWSYDQCMIDIFKDVNEKAKTKRGFKFYFIYAWYAVPLAATFLIYYTLIFPIHKLIDLIFKKKETEEEIKN